MKQFLFDESIIFLFTYTLIKKYFYFLFIYVCELKCELK